MRRTIFIILSLAVLTACNRERNYDAAGTFEATEVTLSSEVTGKVLELAVHEGQEVKQGELLAQIDTTSLVLQRDLLNSQKQSARVSRPDIEKQIAALKQQILTAEREQKRVQGLFEDGVATQKQVDDINSQLALLRSQLVAQQQQLQQGSDKVDISLQTLDIQIKQVEDQIAKCRLTAPIDGTILSHYIEQGELAVVGRPLFKVADMQHMYFRAYFTSEQIADLQLGQEVKVVADFGGDKIREYQGIIESIASESEFTPKSIQTKDSRSNLVYAVRIGVQSDGFIKIGLYGTVEL
jgi:HlyD family secretion protein